MNASFGMDLVRTIFATIDGAVYSLISVLYELLLQLSNVSIFNDKNINDISVRIYSFLGIIMLFKATFSLINYLINPESLNDKTNGAGNLVKNVIITLFLIIIVPYCFDLLYRAQSAILNDELIPRLILGTSEDRLDNMKLIMNEEKCKESNGDPIYVENFREDGGNGDYIAMLTFRPFYQIHSDIDTTNLDLNAYCKGGFSAGTGVGYSKVSNLLNSSIYNAEDSILNSGKYVIDYSFFLSTACGVLVMLLLLEFCLDVAMRCVKLGFLEIAAPIAIISFIDPKSAKSGAFSKWLKEVFGTWARLFIRLAILYFAIYFIGLVNENIDMYMDNGIWIMLFLVIGALLFAKKAVQLIEDIFGFKFDHSIKLNPFKKIEDQALGGKQVLGLPGKALATTTGLALSAGGAIIGHRLKSANMRKKENEYNQEQRNLDNLKNKLQENITRKHNLVNVAYTSPEAFKAAQRVSKEIKQQQQQIKEQKAKVANAKMEYDSAVEKYNKDNSDNEGNKYFSAAYPNLSAIMQALRGAKIALDSKDTQNLAKAITAGVNAARAAAKRTNDFDKFGYLDRIRDLGTDLTGVKNESGTTSIVKKEMKEQNENLENIKSIMASIEHRLGNLPAGMLKYEYDEEDKITKRIVNEEYTNFKPGEREAIQSEINAFYDLWKSEKKIEKSIKEYQEVLDINKAKK